MRIRIKEAILRYNSLLKRPDEEKMTQKKLAEKVIVSKSKSLQSFYISRWSTGASFQGLKIGHIKDMCELLKVDANYLLDIKPMK